MKTVLVAAVFLFLLAGSQSIKAQEWVDKMNDRSVNFYETQQSFESAMGNQAYTRGTGWKQFKRWEAFWEPRVFPHGVRPSPNFEWQEHLKFQETYPASRSSAARSSNWTPLGPISWTPSSYNPGMGRVNIVVEDPITPTTLYVGTPAGGCWKSTDNGVSWTPLTDHFQTLGVSSIAVDYTNNNIIYIGTGDDDASTTNNIGLYKTTDGGATWTETSPNSTSLFGALIYKVQLHPTNPNTVYVASSTGCHRSTDGGATWTLLRSGSWRDMELKPGDPNTIYLSNSTFVYSTDGGTTWSNTVGLPNAGVINRAEIAVSAANPDYVYFLCGDQNDASFYGFYRSENSGASFSLRANSPNIFGYSMNGNGSGGQSWYDMALAVSPTNPEEVYVGGINVWKSTDGGSTWTIKSHWFYPPLVAYTHADIHYLDVVGNKIYCGSDGGVFRSTNGGDQFGDLSDGLSIMQFYRISGSEQVPHKIMGGTQDNGCNLIDETQDALHTNGADGMEVLITPLDSLILYSSSQFGNFNRSDDGGYNSIGIFPSVAGSGAWVTPLVMNPNDNDMLLAGFTQVYLSLDKGNSDQAISNFTSGDLLRNLAISPSDGYTHFYAGTYNNIFATQNSGANWTDITAGLPSAAMSSITVHPTDPLKAWVTFSGYQAGEKVYRTTDGGATWVNMSANLPNLPVNCLVYQNGSHDGIYIGTDVGVYYTDSLLAGWQQYMTGLPNVIVNDFEINYTTGKIRAGTYGRGLWESPLKAPVTTPPVSDFTIANAQTCPTDSIEFMDASVDNAPYWQWHFPGGSPSSSTMRNPKVIYPSTGVYDVMLITQNANGADTMQRLVNITYEPNILDFNIQMDGSSTDVHWKLFDSNDDIVYESPLFALSGTNNQLIERPTCLPAGCYKLVMLDVGGNGLCCGNGNGYYSLTDANGDTLAFGTNYGSTDTTLFCVNQTLGLSLGGSIQDATCGLSDGRISVGALGGDGNYQYSIDNGATFQSSATFSGLAAGSYTILVQDGQGAQSSQVLTVGELYTPVAVASASATTVYLNQGGATNFFSTNSVNASGFSWLFPDGSTSTDANPSFTFSAPDSIQQVILTVTGGSCTDVDTLNILVVNNVNVNKLANNTNIQVIPNPVQEKFVLDVKFGEMQEEVELVIHNALGQRIYWQRLEQVKTFNRSFHFGNEPDGVYIITLLSNQQAISRRFIKQ